MKTQKQIEMEANLPHPDVSRAYCAYIWDKLREAGIPVDANTLSFIGRLTGEFIQATEEGKRLVFQMMRTQISSGSPGDLYFQMGKENTREGLIKSEDLVEYRGWIFRKKIPLPHSAVTAIRGGSLEGCDGCGILGPRQACVTQVKSRLSNGREALESLCNHCRIHSQDISVQHSATRRNCETCPKLNCEHHPSSKQIPLALPPAKRYP